MKAIYLMTALSFGLIACSNNGKDGETDASNHAAHQDTSSVINSVDTSGMAGKSMMSIMNSMMDNMKSIQSAGSPDNDFAALMKAHHLAAIEMAQVELAKGNDPQVKQMAKKMMDDQQKEVAELNTFLSGHDAHGGGDAFYKKAMAAMNKMNMDMDHAGSVDKQFVQMMISHHQAAIDMAKAYLETGAHEEKLKTMSNNIISSQQKEIDDLKTWLAKNN